ncbi:MAG: hypothetical protein ABSH38_01200 [Verrucomicrobiota bacterium]|jgi:hypothetical protein
MWKSLTTGVLLICLTGCIQTKDELTINPDGSGKVRIETRVGADAGSLAAMSGEMGGGIAYPPVSEAEAQKFFPGKDFKITVKQDKTDKGDTVTVIDVEYKDINSLLASPYGRAHQLTVEIGKDGLAVKAVSGMEGIARIAEIKPDKDMGMMAMPGLADMQKKKNEMRVEFRMTLPNTVTAGNGVRDGKSALWISERAKCKDADEFVQQLSAVNEARCDASGLKISPVTPARLGLCPFPELSAGTSAAKGAGPDPAKVTAAAKFIPYGVVITRSVDLSGQGGMNQNSANLVGAVVLPREFEPQKWGEATLDEAVDAKGNDLKPTEANQRDSFFYSRMYMNESEEDDAEHTNTAADLRHTVSFSFRPPDWKIKEIGKIKGSIALHYFGGAEVVKMTNAIPANWIVDPAKGMGRFDSSEKKINSAKLAEMGMPLSLQMAMSQSGMTMLMLQISGKKGVLVDAQVFDAQGKPWPTFLGQQNMGMGEGNGCQLMVPGSPGAPLSLAVVASGSGSSVDVPVLVEHIPLTQ